jgi:putative transposase
MPRRPRLIVAGIPLLITQRGVNGAATFIDREDYRLYRELLAQAAAIRGTNIHAYVLMSNHVHLLISLARASDLAPAMRLLNQRYVIAFNRRHRRTGTLWESRFRSCLVDTERYLLMLYRYIELSPVRMEIADAPERYPWSSAQANLGIITDPCVTPHPVYLALGTDAAARAKAYCESLRCGVANEDLVAIRMHIQQERVLGSPRFQAMVGKIFNRAVAVRPRGRPRKDADMLGEPGTVLGGSDG